MFTVYIAFRLIKEKRTVRFEPGAVSWRRHPCSKLSGFLISERRLNSQMTRGCNWNDSIRFDPATYGDQPYSQRVEHGLTVDRSRDNSKAYLDMNFFAMMEGGMPPAPMFFPITQYRMRRRGDWNTKRWANAQMVDLTNVRKQMVELFTPILLDMLSNDPPTTRDWKKVSEKGEKQVRRTEGYYQHVVGRQNGGVWLRLRDKDGIITSYPKRIVRNDIGDSRVAEIATPYSYPAVGGASFDPRVFADEAYVRRERRFWKDAVRVLSRWLEGGGCIRRQKEWLLRHIVNNDIGLHVLFDNFSVECESRWLKTLDAESQAKFCNGSLRIFDEKGPWIIGGTVPDPYDQGNAEKAVNEHELFVADFEKEVPDNLRQFMIPQDKMRERIRDLIIEAAATLKPHTVESAWAANVRRFCPQTWLLHFADDWERVCTALASSSLPVSYCSI